MAEDSECPVSGASVRSYGANARGVALRHIDREWRAPDAVRAAAVPTLSTFVY